MGLFSKLFGHRAEPILDTAALTADLTALSDLLYEKINTLRLYSEEGAAGAEVYREFLTLALHCHKLTKECLALSALLLPPRNATRARVLTDTITRHVEKATAAVKSCGSAFSFLSDAEKSLTMTKAALEEFSQV